MRPHSLLIALPIVFALVPLGAAAQNNVVAPPPPPREGTIGPEQLRDFSLGGQRERPAGPAPVVPQPTAREPAATAPAPAANTARPTASQPSPPASRVTVGLPPATAPTDRSGFDFTPGPAVRPDPALRTDQSGPIPTPAAPPPRTTSNPIPGDWAAWWPWLLALLAVAAAAIFVVRRRAAADPGRLAFADIVLAPETSAPRVTPPALVPALAPALAPAPISAPAPVPSAAGVGIVSSRLRAWLELEVSVRSAALTADDLELHLDLLITNSGSAAARDIAIEALVLNAGSEQDRELATFFARPDPTTFAADGIGPFGQLPLQPVVRMPRAAFREYQIAGEPSLVPVLALNIGYRAGSAAGRTSLAFLVGRPARGSDKLAPFRTAAEQQGLAANLRRLDQSVRR